jgi:hypothetical protein
MGRASKTDPPLTAGAQAPAAPTLPPDGAALPPALAGRLVASAERAGEAPDAHLERLLGPALDAEEERHPSKTQIRIARGIGIVLAALALAMLVYVVQSGDLMTGVVMLAIGTLAGRFLLWPAVEEFFERGSDASQGNAMDDNPWPGGIDDLSHTIYRSRGIED